MTTRREQLLRATSEAADVFDRFPVGTRTSFDIVGATTELGIPLLFRPLAGLWGASITVEQGRGVLVTTKLGLAVQRFTLAHELGHVLLGHKTSFDECVHRLRLFGLRVGEDDPMKRNGPWYLTRRQLAELRRLFTAAQLHREATGSSLPWRIQDDGISAGWRTGESGKECIAITSPAYSFAFGSEVAAVPINDRANAALIVALMNYAETLIEIAERDAEVATAHGVDL